MTHYGLVSAIWRRIEPVDDVIPGQGVKSLTGNVRVKLQAQAQVLTN